jgi:hypothetical protein
MTDLSTNEHYEYMKDELKGYKLRMPDQNPPIFSEDMLTQKPTYGILEKLEGTWVNYNPTGESKFNGLHNTSMPAPGSNSETVPGVFHFVCDDYVEELHFKLIPDKVRNRGGSNEQFAGCVEYSQTIKDLNGVGLHEENGMYLYMREICKHPVDEEALKHDFLNHDPNVETYKLGDVKDVFLPYHSICRMGTIPHGNSLQLLGSDYVPMKGKPKFPKGEDTWDFKHVTLHPTMVVNLGNDDVVHNLDERPPLWANEVNPPGARQYVQRVFQHTHYPYSVRPDLRLRDAIDGQEMKDHVVIDLCTRYEVGVQGSVSNTPMVAKYCPVTEVRYRMWLETVIEDGEEILQLQYEQIVMFEFSPFLDGSIARWPHIQVNTLRQKKWVDTKCGD